MRVIEDHRLFEMMAYPIGRDMDNVMYYAKIFAELITAHAPKDRVLNFLCRGSSGAILAGIVSSLMPEAQTKVSHIKKEGENSHSEYLNFAEHDYIIIIDDFISSGNTVNRIHEKFYNQSLFGGKVHMLIVSAEVSNNVNFIHEIDTVICGIDRVSEYEIKEETLDFSRLNRLFSSPIVLETYP